MAGPGSSSKSGTGMSARTARFRGYVRSLPPSLLKVGPGHLIVDHGPDTRLWDDWRWIGETWHDADLGKRNAGGEANV